MAEEEHTDQTRSIGEIIQKIPGAHQFGPIDDRKKRQAAISTFYEDQEETRDVRIQAALEETVNEPPRSIGERIEGN
jgi:hypothetical protein